jgi:hypothetical protein
MSRSPTTVTIGRDGNEYYFRDGKRVTSPVKKINGPESIAQLPSHLRRNILSYLGEDPRSIGFLRQTSRRFNVRENEPPDVGKYFYLNLQGTNRNVPIPVKYIKMMRNVKRSLLKNINHEYWEFVKIPVENMNVDIYGFDEEGDEVEIMIENKEVINIDPASAYLVLENSEDDTIEIMVNYPRLPKRAYGKNGSKGYMDRTLKDLEKIYKFPDYYGIEIGGGKTISGWSINIRFQR